MTFRQTGTPVAFVNVTDRDRALAFYGETLGLPVRSSDGFGDFLDLGGALLRITALAGHVPSGHPVLAWNVAEIGAAVDALTARGIVFTVHDGFGQDERGIWTSPDGASKLAWFSDPDGNVLMISQS
jgi:catechol 2,3-dioxygenase-like lactoylglutathione lyase family enzyme